MSPSTYPTQPETMCPASFSYVTQRSLDTDYRLAVYREARLRQAEEIARIIHLAAQAIAKPFRALAARYQAWRAYQTAYEELAGLSERELADIGLTKADIDRVAHGDWKPFGRDEAEAPKPAPAAVDLVHPTTPKLAA